MVPRRVIAFYFENHMKYVNRLREEKKEYFKVKAAG
jgi:hypothetical protein